MDSWDVWGSIDDAVAWSVRQSSIWVLRSQIAASFRNFPASRLEVEIWRENTKTSYIVEVRDFDVEEFGLFTSLSANAGETAVLLVSLMGCAVFAVPSSGTPVQEVLPAKTLLPRYGALLAAKWHPLSDTHVGLLLENQWELMNFHGSSQALLAPEQTIKIRAKDFCFAEKNANLNWAFRVLFLEETGIVVHRSIPSVALLPAHLVAQCPAYRWLSKPAVVDADGAILRTTTFPEESAFHELPEGPVPTQIVVLTCHPLVVLAVARDNGIVDIVSLESGPALLCDHVDTAYEEAVVLHCFGPSTTFIAVAKHMFVCSMSLPWVEKLLGGGRTIPGPHTEIKTVVEGNVRDWTNISSSKGMCHIEGAAPQIFDYSRKESSLALMPSAERQRAVSYFAAPLMLPAKPDFFPRSDSNPEALCRALAAVQKGVLDDLAARQHFMKQFVKDAPRRVQQSKEDWENLVAKIKAASSKHRRSMEVMDTLKTRQRALERQTELVATQLEDFAKSASLGHGSADLSRLHAKIYQLHQVVQMRGSVGADEYKEVKRLVT